MEVVQWRDGRGRGGGSVVGSGEGEDEDEKSIVSLFGMLVLYAR